jgi:hypothetical protein
MADVNISKFRAQVVRDGSKPATPGFVVSEGQSPTDPAGSGQNHLPVTIAAASTGLAITESQILGGAGTVSQYIRGDGSLADFPSITGGGSSVSYYLNGSVSQGTIGGVAYRELNRTPVFGAGTDISINADGYIASFITDAGDPNKLEIPAANWNFETYFSASSSGGSPSFYVELYKYNGTTFTLIATSSSSPELIAFGTNLNPYFSTLAVPQTTLALTDRLAVRFYVNHSGRTITLHTEDNHLCQIITSFTTGLTALNGLTAQVQNFATGTTGTDFNIASATATHTFNLPTASGTNRGALSSSDWTTFNNKQNALGFTPVPETRTITINGTTQDLSANRTYNVGTVTSVAALTLGTSGTDLSSTVANGTTTPVITLNVPTASASNRGALSSADWSTFNGKQNALTLTTTGSSGAATLVGSTLNIPIYSPDLSGYVPTSRTITINGTTQDLSANRTFNVGTVTSVGLSSATSGVTIGSTPVTGSGTITLAIATASGSQNGLLSSTDWTTFNSKQNALTNPVTGTGTTNYLPKFTGASTIGNSQIFDNGTNVGIGTATPYSKIDVAGSISINGRPVFDNSTTELFIGGITGVSGRGTDIVGFYTSNSEKMRITSGGNVLIGTTTDGGARLQIVSSGVALNMATGNGQMANINSTNANGGYITWQTSGTTIADLGTAQQVFGAGGNDTFGINARGARSLILGTNDTARLTITSTGAATFSSTLDTSGRVTITADSGNEQFTIRRASNTNAQLITGVHSSGYAWMQSIEQNVAYRPLVLNRDGGNVLIGTTTAQSGTRLQVAGVMDVWSSSNTLLRFNHDGTRGLIETFTGGAYGPTAINANGGNVMIGSTTDNGSKLQVNGAIRTAQPVGTTSNGWLLGRALVSGTSTPNRWIRVQIGLEYYDILAVYMGTL